MKEDLGELRRRLDKELEDAEKIMEEETNKRKQLGNEKSKKIPK